jgi:1-acyl-sn-glycerol-3-phosphate acyltransferase
VTWLCKRTARFKIRRKLKVVDIEISADDLDALRRLRGKRCLLMPSHSGGFEPYLIVYLSKLLRDDYYYLAAIEAFQRHPIIGWIMQHMGAYSIIRGAADRPSFQTTRKILAEGKHWLVVFPEGQTVWQNDTVIPFQEGITQLAFKALEDAGSVREDSDLACIPMAIKYVYLNNMESDVEESLRRLESQLFKEPVPDVASSYDRIRRIGEAVLAANEQRHGIQPDADAQLNSRIQCIKEAIVREIEQQLGIVPRANMQLLDRIRGCFNAVDRIVSADASETPYRQKLADEHSHAMAALYDDLWRVLQFVAIYDGYVGELLTVERFMDVLCLLEMEVFNERRIWGPRKAIIKVGEPISLRDHLDTYRAGKREAVQAVSMAVESSVRSMLEHLSTDHSTPMNGAEIAR